MWQPKHKAITGWLRQNGLVCFSFHPAGKQFAGTALLGQEFMELLAFTDFKNKQSTMPWIRMSLATCQMCSPKAYIKDGVSRFITPSDFTKLKQKAMLDKVKQAEELLGKAMSFCKHLH